MRRLCYDQLVEWKNDPWRKPLILEGVRQCGKTYLLEEFGSKNYENTAYFNFEDEKNLASHFERDLNPRRIIEELSILIKRPILPEKTLIIFDEIQFCGRALTSLKYFCEKAPEYHVVCAGSLLGVKLSKEDSFPVGKVNRIRMYPMNFFEFLLANGEDLLCDHLKKLPAAETVPQAFEDKLTGYLRTYYVVGGMPAVVYRWVLTKDISAVETLQDEILRDYVDDFGKHAADDLNELTMIWRSIPEQLSKENRRFFFSHVKKGLRAKDLEHAMEWLISAGLIYKVKMISAPMVPLSSYSDETIFKIYFADIGLLRKLAGVDPAFIFDGNGKYKHFKGAVAENYVLNELLFIGKSPYFWKSGGVAEVDFIDNFGTKTVPIEVKAETNTKSKSLAKFIDLYRPECAVKISMNNVSKNGIIGLPLWMVWKIKDYIGETGRKDLSMNE